MISKHESVAVSLLSGKLKSGAKSARDPCSTANSVRDGKTMAEERAIGNRAVEACLDVVDISKGDKFVSMTLPMPDKLPSGVSAQFIFASDLKNSEVSKVIFEDFLPKTLAEGKYVATPDPELVGKGLEYIQ